jgi:HSP20 family protein
MAIIRWNPWNLSSLLEDDLDLPTPFSRLGMGQGLNLYETEDEVVAEAALPGISEDKVDVTVDEGIVRITATAQVEDEQKDGRRYYMTSRAQSFNYSFRLPVGLISEEEPTCELEHGVLILRFKKVQKAPPKKIEVKAKNKVTTK